ncbi:MAG: hypothetical protein RRZ24_00795 [Clostridia bacterium]
MKEFAITKKKLIGRILTATACFALLGILGGSTYAYMAPTAYVSMDVNPSIEYTLNTFGRVLTVRAVNEDGAEILQEMNLKDLNNNTINEAIKLTLNEITAKGYFDGNAPGGIVIATSGKEPITTKNLAEFLKEVVTTQCADNHQNVSVETMTVNQAQLDEAKALGVTPGKLLLVQELMSESPDANIVAEEWLTKSVKDIMAEIERIDALEDAAEDAADAAEDAEDVAKDAAEEAAEMAEKERDALAEAAEKQKDAEAEAKELAEEAERDAVEEAEQLAEKEKDDAAEASKMKNDAAEEAKDAAKDTEDAGNEPTETEDSE